VKQTDPMAELRDIHLPDAISWWPLAPGWWLLIIISLAAIAYICAMLLKNYRERLYRRQALLRLHQIRDCAQQQQLTALFELLKQVAASAYPHQYFASLAPRDFVHFLQNTCKMPIFKHSHDHWETLLYSDQQPPPEQLLEQLHSDAKLWIKQHPSAARLEYKPAC